MSIVNIGSCVDQEIGAVLRIKESVAIVTFVLRDGWNSDHDVIHGKIKDADAVKSVYIGSYNTG